MLKIGQVARLVLVDNTSKGVWSCVDLIAKILRETPAVAPKTRPLLFIWVLPHF